ncbi:uroporphyrin-III C-methyltransferase/precorrin-2 dehydrogenase/sirohydrochlorin ferrochelatase [Kineococcus radiotolerans]|uniref:Uroporphyrin-III C-methyltransferase/precorrin-2 dehydrogenase/sirohydrochlorin ferrochelatase n=1 Tax=Kineococcus radiotolerans TaxID=131568 RepID=A0A7W4TJE4_KINRA|nr:uroporphyrinogen-III C-methyltransferase [Kineococcus radiotolerans]MBB2899990.1 uroporphyrin-III C-methyltransferase/precorrin-2 dehydrogenase/sirohydrochlorin ferrochelatase [Kineococcus radiotolerans]
MTPGGEEVGAVAYPLHLDVSGRRVLVAGGGPVAARRARDLVAAGAEVLVVAPAVCEDLRDLLPDLTWEQREVEPRDVADAWLVHTATGDPRADAEVAAAAEALRVWCVRADDARASSAWTPSVVRREGVTVSVTAGGDPRRARGLREALSRWLDSGAAPLRRRRPGAGRVTLVGGGPGEVDLLTLRGRRRLAEADVVVVDRLAPTAVLDELDPDVQVVDVGKTPDHHPVPQEEINRIIVEHARAGRRVVRLKGGDNYVLGRGGEEVLACRAAGVEVEVVPGVTSAFAVPAAAGIPVTHRGLSRSVTVVSGHEDVDAATLARLDGTVVFLMGVTMLPRLCADLVAAGKPASTPVAIVENGWRPDQRTTRGTLGDIAATAARRGVRSPAVIVVGAVAGLAGVADEEGVTVGPDVAYRPLS